MSARQNGTHNSVLEKGKRWLFIKPNESQSQVGRLNHKAIKLHSELCSSVVNSSINYKGGSFQILYIHKSNARCILKNTACTHYYPSS